KRMFTVMFQFHQRANADRFAIRELAGVELFKLGDSGFKFRRLLGLAAREIGGFKPARVILILSLVGLGGCLRAGELRGTKANREFASQLVGYFPDEDAFVQGEGEKWLRVSAI